MQSEERIKMCLMAFKTLMNEFGDTDDPAWETHRQMELTFAVALQWVLGMDDDPPHLTFLLERWRTWAASECPVLMIGDATESAANEHCQQCGTPGTIDGEATTMYREVGSPECLKLCQSCSVRKAAVDGRSGTVAIIGVGHLAGDRSDIVKQIKDRMTEMN